MDANEDKLNEEVVKAADVKRAKELFLDKYLKAKREALFSNFTDPTITDSNTLILIKTMAVVLDQMESEINNIMDTGKLAKITLDAIKETNTNV